jgi:hypothetical protein
MIEVEERIQRNFGDGFEEELLGRGSERRSMG